IERSIGVSIGRRMGWPAERGERMQGEYVGYVASLSPPTGNRPDLGCPTIQRELDNVRRRATLGETGALREWVAQSGKKPEDFVRAQRALQQAQEADAATRYLREQAASAVANAPASSPH